MKEKRIMIQVTFDDVESNLNSYAIFIANLYTYYLPTISVTNKVVVEFIKETNVLIIIPDQLGEDIYTIIKSLDFSAFENKNSDKKKEILFNAVFECLKILFTKLKINLQNLYNAHKKILENNYELKRVLCGGLKENRAKDIVATVMAEHFLDYALSSVSFYFKNTKVEKKIILYKTGPVDFIYSRLIWSARWEDNKTFQLSNKTKEINLSINIDGSISILYFPIDRDIQGIKEEINYLAQDIYFEL
jgi:hypothetical protein